MIDEKCFENRALRLFSKSTTTTKTCNGQVFGKADDEVVNAVQPARTAESCPQAVGIAGQVVVKPGCPPTCGVADVCKASPPAMPRKTRCVKATSSPPQAADPLQRACKEAVQVSQSAGTHRKPPACSPRERARRQQQSSRAKAKAHEQSDDSSAGGTNAV